MKTIDEILKRDDYKKLVPALRSRAEEVAHLIKEKMVDLDLRSFDGTGFSLHIVRSRTNCGSYEYLAFDAGESDYYYAHRFYCLDGAYQGYVHDDFNHPCYTASNGMMLKFLNNAKEIIEKLDEIETEKVKSITEALKNVEEL
jgi:hypothetical protein